MTKKHKKAQLIYIDHLLILASTITGCISVSALSSLIGIPRNYKFCHCIEIVWNGIRNQKYK